MHAQNDNVRFSCACRAVSTNLRQGIQMSSGVHFKYSVLTNQWELMTYRDAQDRAPQACSHFPYWFNFQPTLGAILWSPTPGWWWFAHSECMLSTCWHCWAGDRRHFACHRSGKRLNVNGWPSSVWRGAWRSTYNPRPEVTQSEDSSAYWSLVTQ